MKILTMDSKKKDLYNLYSVFVGKLAPTVTKEDLYDLFSGCGVIEDLFICDRDGNTAQYHFGFVRYSSLESVYMAVKTLHRWPLKGSKIVVDISKDTGERIQRAGDVFVNVDKTTRPVSPPPKSSRQISKQKVSETGIIQNVMHMGRVKECYSSLLLEAVQHNKGQDISNQENVYATRMETFFDDMEKSSGSKTSKYEGWIKEEASADRVYQNLLNSNEAKPQLGVSRANEFMSALKIVMHNMNQYLNEREAMTNSGSELEQSDQPETDQMTKEESYNNDQNVKSPAFSDKSSESSNEDNSNTCRDSGVESEVEPRGHTEESDRDFSVKKSSELKSGDESFFYNAGVSGKMHNSVEENSTNIEKESIPVNVEKTVSLKSKSQSILNFLKNFKESTSKGESSLSDKNIVISHPPAKENTPPNECFTINHPQIKENDLSNEHAVISFQPVKENTSSNECIINHSPVKENTSSNEHIDINHPPLKEISSTNDCTIFNHSWIKANNSPKEQLINHSPVNQSTTSYEPFAINHPSAKENTSSKDVIIHSPVNQSTTSNEPFVINHPSANENTLSKEEVINHSPVNHSTTSYELFVINHSSAKENTLSEEQVINHSPVNQSTTSYEPLVINCPPVKDSTVFKYIPVNVDEQFRQESCTFTHPAFIRSQSSSLDSSVSSQQSKSHSGQAHHEPLTSLCVKDTLADHKSLHNIAFQKETDSLTNVANFSPTSNQIPHPFPKDLKWHDKFDFSDCPHYVGESPVKMSAHTQHLPADFTSCSDSYKAFDVVEKIPKHFPEQSIVLKQTMHQCLDKVEKLGKSVPESLHSITTVNCNGPNFKDRKTNTKICKKYLENSQNVIGTVSPNGDETIKMKSPEADICHSGAKVISPNKMVSQEVESIASAVEPISPKNTSQSSLKLEEQCKIDLCMVFNACKGQKQEITDKISTSKLDHMFRMCNGKRVDLGTVSTERKRITIGAFDRKTDRVSNDRNTTAVLENNVHLFAKLGRGKCISENMK